MGYGLPGFLPLSSVTAVHVRGPGCRAERLLSGWLESLAGPWQEKKGLVPVGYGGGRWGGVMSGRCHDIFIIVSVKMLQWTDLAVQRWPTRDVIWPRSAWTWRVEGTRCWKLPWSMGSRQCAMGYGREACLVGPKLPDDENPCRYSLTISILGALSCTT